MSNYPENTEQTQSNASTEQKAEEIDIQLLAEEVYGLLKEDLRIESERLGRYTK